MSHTQHIPVPLANYRLYFLTIHNRMAIIAREKTQKLYYTIITPFPLTSTSTVSLRTYRNRYAQSLVRFLPQDDASALADALPPTGRRAGTLATCK